MKKRKLYHRLLYGLFVISRICIPLLPLRVIQTLGSWLGLVAWAGLPGQRSIAHEHLTMAMGQELSLRERRRVIRRMFQHLGMNALEWFAMPKFDAARIKHCIRVRGMERLAQALADGRGALFISAHFGNWELLAAYFGALGYRGGVVARRLRYPEYESWLVAMRRAQGVETFARDSSFRELVRRLKDNQCIGIMPDQDVDSVDGVFVEFFGRPTWTPTGPAALALTTGAAVLPAYIVREGRRFRIDIEERLPVTRSAHREHDMAALTQAWSRVTEQHIRAHPDHWVWMHRRWKTQPQAGSTAGDAV